MIPHGEAVRNAVRVEWMRLDDREALAQAKAWLHSHGLRAGLAATEELVISGQKPFAPYMHARLGQVLAYNPASGEFTVWDEEQFQAAHSEVAGARSYDGGKR